MREPQQRCVQCLPWIPPPGWCQPRVAPLPQLWQVWCAQLLLHHYDDRMTRTFARDKNACVNIAQAAISILLNGVPSSQVQQFADEQNYHASGMTSVSTCNATSDSRHVSQIRTCLRSTRGWLMSSCSNRWHTSFALLRRDSIDRCDKHHDHHLPTINNHGSKTVCKH